MSPTRLPTFPSVLLLVLLFIYYSPCHGAAEVEMNSKSSSTSPPGMPFSAALETLQKQIGYHFQAVDLLRRAMTHPSYSRDNYRSLSILGLDAVQASVSLRSLQKDIDISPAALHHRIFADTDIDSCAADGIRLGLQNVVKVSAKTNTSSPVVICGAFRAIFGAIALDSGKSDTSGDVFRRVHLDGIGGGAFYA